ncbi:FliM/FliN family flagellar motor switch protein, partial [Stenotrophomonas maltophilia]
FELGRRSLPLSEIRALGAGHVFDLGLDPDQPVDLVANGTRIGRGEIVEIGERVGVRVTRLFGQDGSDRASGQD